MALSKLAVRRLTTLAEFMHDLSKSQSKRFDMDTISSDPRHPCKSVMCASGWASQVPAFKRAGIDPNPYWTDDNKFFDITDIQWFHLFDSNLKRTIKTPKQWARHCRKFIKRETA